MNSFVSGLLLSLACILQSLDQVSATIDITYPIAGTNYTSQPYQIQWTSDSGDPSNITIYLTTYNSSNVLINESRSLTWDTSSGSTYITMTEAPPKGNSWTWMFYDTSKPLNLDQNEIVESAHFFFPGSLLPPVPGTTPFSSHHTIVLCAAEFIGASVTLTVVVVCLLAYICCYRKRQRINMASRTRPLINQEMQVSAAPLPVLSDSSGLTASASAPHELYGNTQGDYNPQLPTSGNTSQISRSELQMQSPQNAAFPTIKRKEIGGAWQ